MNLTFPRRALFLLATGIVAVGFPPATSLADDESNAKGQLRVLCYNIHHAEGVDRKLDVPRIANIIKSVEPDIVALQEVDKKTTRVNGIDEPAELAKLTEMHVVFERNIRFAGGEYGNAVLSRFPFKSHRNIHLPNFDNGEQRGVLICQLQIPGRESPLTFFCTHLDHRSDDKERVASAKRINELTLEIGDAPMLLAGDLNATRDSQVLTTFQKLWTIANAKELPTVPVKQPRRQIDFVLVRPAAAWKVVEVKVLDEAVASDHRAILAVVELR
ncbi:MAG: endonuclease/exonuclease/phosphatase family protein [Pirellulaceae bacterium]|jgi:endonuclease/exonuclease/phosphatase family metal-dependent hydrolase|nr:endonuclease/exonuclease/phosphatase family protein [Pirellulaceae bacterium]MDP7020540.1 endonuclease/exonuclease/phosphatase family protein [Pirellulaceae bacterium]